jgi:hypothetical protein
MKLPQDGVSWRILILAVLNLRVLLPESSLIFSGSEKYSDEDRLSVYTARLSINRLTLLIVRDGRSLGSSGTQTQASGDGIAG